MREILAALMIASPAAGALALGASVAAGRSPSERAARTITLAAVGLSLMCALWFFAGAVTHPAPVRVVLAPWIHSGDYTVHFEVLIDALSTATAVASAGLCLLVASFSSRYMHRERGFLRFYALLGLFAAAMLLLIMGGNLVMTFAGWEGAGLCSYLLIGYHYDRSAPARAATRAFLMTRVGDAAFIAAIALAFIHTGAVDYTTLSARAGALTPAAATAIALGLLTAALAKSGQLPFSPWLTRAMEGPTPSSALFYGAVMVNAGIYLILRARPVFDASPAALWTMAGVGAATAILCAIVSLAQTDIKSALILGVMGQLGLMFFACGVGAYGIAAIHMLAHALLRAWQLLTAPSILQTAPRPSPSSPRASSHPLGWVLLSAAVALLIAPLIAAGGLRTSARFTVGSAAVGALLLAFVLAAPRLRGVADERPSAEVLVRLRWLYAAALHRLFLEAIYARFIVDPILRLGRALAAFDAHVLDRAAGGHRPATQAPRATPWDIELALRESAGRARAVGAHRPPPHEIGLGAGVVGRLLQGAASAMHSVERHIVASAIGRGVPRVGHLLGGALTRVEALLERPAIACLVLLACVLLVLKGTL